MQHINDKYKEAGHEFLRGSNTGPTYLLVAKDEVTNAALGIKIEGNGAYYAGASILIVAVRVRLAPYDDNAAFNMAPAEKTFPFPFEKTGFDRNSLMVHIALKRGANDLWCVPSDLAQIKFAEQVAAYLEQFSPKQTWVISDETLLGFINETVLAKFSSAAHPTAAGLKMQIRVTEASLVALKSQLASLAGKEQIAPPVDHLITELLGTEAFTAKLSGGAGDDDADSDNGDEEDDGETADGDQQGD